MASISPPPPGSTPGATRAGRLRELAGLFLRLGLTAFGGPAAHVALMEDEVVRRRGWMTRQHFLDLLGATNLIPGPNSTEMVIHIGHARAGFPGLVVAGLCFIVPAVAVTLALAWVYVTYGTLPAAGALLYGVKPVIVAVVLQALVGLARSAARTPLLAVVGLAAGAAALAGGNELVALAAAGMAVPAVRAVARRRGPGGRGSLLLAWPLAQAAAPASAAGASAFSLWGLLAFFLKVGSVLYGSGYVLLAFLRADLVERYGWLTEKQLLDAVAVGQVTPGPVFSTATFIGYVLGRGPGAAVATAGIFLPAFVFVALSGPLVPRLRRSVAAGDMLDGINVASLGLMAAVTLSLGRAALVDVPTAVLTGAAAVLLLRWRVNSTWLVLGGAAAGLLLQGAA